MRLGDASAGQLLGAPCRPVARTRTLRVLTLNLGLVGLHVGRCFAISAHIAERLIAAPGLIGELQPDIIALQEVFDHRDQRFLAQKLARSYPFAFTASCRRSLYGNGLMYLSKLPIRGGRFVPFHGGGSAAGWLWEQGFLQAEFGADDRPPLHLINVHLVANEPLTPRNAAATRRRRTQEIKALLTLGHQTRAILLGDFNASPVVAPEIYLAVMEAGYRDTFIATNGTTEEPTWDARILLNHIGIHRREPSQRIDHIFVPNTIRRHVVPDAATIVLKDPMYPIGQRTMLHAVRSLRTAGATCMLAATKRRMGKHPDNAFTQALAHHQAGRLAEAERAYRAILARTPDEPHAQHLLGVVALQTGHLAESESLLRGALKRAPESAEIQSNLGLVLAATGRIDEAIEVFHRAIALRPDYAEAHHNLGLAFEHRGQVDAALTHYARAVEIKPDYGDALCHLAMALHMAKRTEEAATFYRRALAATTGLERLWVYLAAALATSGDATGARDALDTARMHKVDDRLIGLCQSLLAYRADDNASALEVVRQRQLIGTYWADQPADPIESALWDALSANTTFIANARQAREARKPATIQHTDRAEHALTAFALSPAPPPLIVAPTSRDWMDKTPNRFAYRCLPMVIANQAGWLVLNPRALAVTWDGSDSVPALRVEYLDDNDAPSGYSHFGAGILTWNVPYLFRTPPGYNLHVRGPANYPKDGVYALEGIVETDWNDATFTMNWQLTRPHHRVVFEADEPIAMVVPQKRGELESFRPEIRDIADEPQLELSYRKWSALRDQANRTRHDPNSIMYRVGWQRHYMLGFTVTMEPAPEHQTGLTLRAFTDRRA